MAGQRMMKNRVFGAVLLAALVPFGARADSNLVKVTPVKPVNVDKLKQQSDDIGKSDRLLPDPAEQQSNVLTLPSINEAERPSQGLNVLDRMGANLPDLPKEKKYAGKIDDAYGAFQRGLYLTAMNLALPKAQRGDAASQTLVAELLDSGLGVRRNESDALFWYEQAANAGDPKAQFKYTLMLMEGRRVKRDLKLADQMMQKAADGGNAEAQFNIAQLKVAQTPGEKGLMDALPYYEKSAMQGIPDAEYALSQLYISLPVPKEKQALARYWLEQAANQRFDTAMYDMGVWNINGIAGDRDYDTGFLWMKRAADNGNVVAMNKLAYLYINAIGTRPDPIEAAKWYVLSRRAGLSDLGLEDFYLGIEDDQQQEAIRRADAFRR